MAMIQKQNGSLGAATQADEKFYTKLGTVNTMLNRFVKECDMISMWASIEADGLSANCMPEDAYSYALELALGVAKANCIETTPPRNRFIKLRSRDVQKQIFVKIEYACENRKIKEFDKHIVKLHELVEKAGGYVKINLEKEFGCIKIAVPK